MKIDKRFTVKNGANIRLAGGRWQADDRVSGETSVKK